MECDLILEHNVLSCSSPLVQYPQKRATAIRNSLHFLTNCSVFFVSGKAHLTRCLSSLHHAHRIDTVSVFFPLKGYFTYLFIYLWFVLYINSCLCNISFCRRGGLKGVPIYCGLLYNLLHTRIPLHHCHYSATTMFPLHSNNFLRFLLLFSDSLQ
jgi:hypothetical protein